MGAGSMKSVSLISGGGSTSLAMLQAQQKGGRLFGIFQTVAIVSSNPSAAGITKAIKFGFPGKHIHTVNPGNNLGQDLLGILNIYQPDLFHQLGWEPHTPDCVLEAFMGLNQHLGPGGKYMYYERRICAHRIFCEKIGEERPLPIFCQKVATSYDEGDAVYAEYDQLWPGESDEETSRRLLATEHRVQIEGAYRIATGQANFFPVPRVYETPGEKIIMDEARKEARDRYPNLLKT